MQNDFEYNLIKGRIAEMVFELMMRESGAFTVIPFGYENTIHELLHYQNIKKTKRAIQRVKKAPDFVVISSETKTVHLVEVKYRKNPTPKYLKQIAKEMVDLWDPSWLFVASLKEFYFDSAEFVIKNNGKMQPLDIKSITPELRKKYLELLNTFEQ
ncbi:MAG: hypothetical protein WD712_00235 [Candidatus Spechtbacterales bacterium]